jgi:hypothetical protein
MSDPHDSTSTGNGASLSSTFLEFCSKVRNNDTSILPELGEPFCIRRDLNENEDMELADALMKNNSVAFLKLETEKYTKRTAEAMVKYVRTSRRLQRIDWPTYGITCEEMLCCFLPAIQESTSLKELQMKLSVIAGPSSLAFENMLTHTQSLQSLSLNNSDSLLKDTVVAAVRSGLEKNTSLRELTLHCMLGATTVSPLLTSLCDHPLLQRLCLHGHVLNLTGLETVWLSENSKITELEINKYSGGQPLMGLTRVLQSLGRRPALTKLVLNAVPLNRDEARQLGKVLCNTQSLQSLVLKNRTLGSARLAELAPALYRNTPIKVLDMSANSLDDMESARLLRDIIRRNKTMTSLDLSRNYFGRTAGTVECIMAGISRNTTLLKILLSR